MGLITAYDFHGRISNCISGRLVNDEVSGYYVEGEEGIYCMQTSESAMLAEASLALT